MNILPYKSEVLFRVNFGGILDITTIIFARSSCEMQYNGVNISKMLILHKNVLNKKDDYFEF